MSDMAGISKTNQMITKWQSIIDDAPRDMLSFYETAARNSAKLVLAIVQGL